MRFIKSNRVQHKVCFNFFASMALGFLVCANSLGQESDVSSTDVSAKAETEEETGNQPEELIAIRQVITSYEEAFNARNVSVLRKHWTDNGTYERVDERVLNGQASIVNEFETFFNQEPGIKLKLETQTLDLISANVAIESGVALVQTGDQTFLSPYETIFVRQGKAWLVDRVTEQQPALLPKAYEHLKDLEFLVGTWTSQIEETSVTYQFNWTENRSFLSLHYRVTNAPNGESSSGLQMIGWDELAQAVRGWTFESSGIVTTSDWRQSEQRWVSQAVATLLDGNKSGHTIIIRPISTDEFGWQKVNNVVDGELLPNIEEVIVRRAMQQN